MTTQEQSTFLSRWGFHPVDHETYLKLKRLKKLFWEAVRTHGRYERWERKRPENRFYWEKKEYGVKRKRSDRPIPEPVTCPVFWRENSEHWDAEAKKWRKPLTPIDDRGVLAAFQLARMPVKNATDVKPIALSVKEIDEMLAEAEKWYAEK
jgi:hypothetical protein